MWARVGFENQDSWKIKLQLANHLNFATYDTLCYCYVIFTFTFWYNCFYENVRIPCYYPNCIILIYYIG